MLSTFPSRIAYFITGHGYGHAARSARLINAFPPGTHVVVFTTIDPGFFARTLSGSHDVVHCEIDCGCVQRDAASIDIPATLARYRALNDRRDALIERHAAELRHHGIQLVLADIPPLAFPIAGAAGVPALGLSNFTWADIYDDYLDHEPGFAPVLEAMRRDYALADAYLRLYPHAGEVPCERVVDVGLLLADDEVRPRHEIAEALDLDPAQPWCLVYFGASGLNEAQWSGLRAYPDWRFIGLYELPGASANYRQVALSPGLRNADLVAGSDAVLGKLGYGLVSECLHFGKPFIHPNRRDFREYGFLRDALHARGLGCEIAEDDLLRCQLGARLEWCRERAAARPAQLASGTRDILAFIARWWREHAPARELSALKA